MALFQDCSILLYPAARKQSSKKEENHPCNEATVARATFTSTAVVSQLFHMRHGFHVIEKTCDSREATGKDGIGRDAANENGPELLYGLPKSDSRRPQKTQPLAGHNASPPSPSKIVLQHRLCRGEGPDESVG